MGAVWHASHVMVGLLTRRAIVAGSALLAASLVAAPPGLAAASPAALSGVHVFGWGLNGPESIALDGAHVWVANFGGNSVTELSARTGGLVRVISGARYKLEFPDAIASDGTDVWVASAAGQSVTEFPAR